jgi:hypothetical protein
MTERNPWRHGPTRGELWFWLWLSLGGFLLAAVALLRNGLPTGPAIVEVLVMVAVVFGYLGGRSIKRLIRREHP